MRCWKSLLALSVLGTTSLFAAQDPNIARGIAPSTTFRSFDLDAINELNGNLMLRIPIGGPLPVGPSLSQNLVLVYNSKLYDFEYYDDVDVLNRPIRRRRPVLEKNSNAGFGWILDLGRLEPPKVAVNGQPPRGWYYRAADGSEHDFTGNSTANGGDVPEAVTRDGSFLRLTRYPADLASPVQYREITFPDGTVHRFTPSGHLTKILDRLGHWIAVSDPDAMTWLITNGHGTTTFRTTTINFMNRTPPADYTYPDNFRKVISSIVVPAFGAPAATATYQFVYADETRPFEGCGDTTGFNKLSFAAPFLKEIRFPDGSIYAFPKYSPSNTVPCTAGIVEELKLPTLGSIAWTHQAYDLPHGQCDDELDWLSTSGGVETRTLKGPEGEILGRWTYQSEVDIHPDPNTQIKCGAMDGENSFAGPPPTQVKTTVTTPEGSTVHYFSGARAWEVPHREEYGLPFTRNVPASPAPDNKRFLSSERRNSAGTVLQSTYLSYEGDADPLTGKLSNPRVSGELTRYNSDTGCNGLCEVDVDRTNYDGYGHYRQSDTTSNFGPERTVFTNFGPRLDSWILGVYDYSWVKEGGIARKEMFTFDANGFRTSRRTLKGTAANADGIAPNPGDLIEVQCRDTRGFLKTERFFGGDGVTEDVTPLSWCSGTDTVSPRPTEYQIDHTFNFENATGAPTKHTAAYRGMNFFTIDEDLDARTGLVSASRDLSGVETTFAYDALGRLTRITPTGTPSVLYEYTNATSSTNPARLRVTTRTADTTENVLTDAYVYYDSLGRPVQERRLMPSDSGSQWSTMNTSYDMFSRPVRVTVPQYRSSAAYEAALPDTTPVTSNTYDSLGRPTMVTGPDGKATSIAYQGAREVIRTTDLGATHERYDSHGRLIDLTEPNGTHTGYTYHLTGSLAKVCANQIGSTCGQTRTFTYDNRGFLTQEKHPESESTSYTYDARGHVLTKTIAGATSPVNLRFSYDSAERMKQVDTFHAPLGPFWPGKVYSFGIENVAGNKTLGKLISAKRYNYVAGEVVVTERYEYADPAGRLTKTTTEITHAGNPVQTLEQGQTYGPSGNVETISYPTCFNAAQCGAAIRNTVNRTFLHGLLTNVAGFTDSISYAAAGPVSSVDHAGPVVDKYTPDATGVRVKSIEFTGYSQASTPCASVALTAGTPQDQTIAPGQTAALTVIASGQNTYQWYGEDETAISGATSATYTTPLLSSGSKAYFVTVSNGCSTVQSRIATVTVAAACEPVSITSGTPQDRSILPDTTAALTVSASGATSYQWYEEDGTAVNGATFPTFTTPALSSQKRYYVRVSNGCQTVQSRIATVSVRTLAEPTGLAAVANSPSTVQLSWNGSVDAHHYIVQRKIDGSGFTNYQAVSDTLVTLQAPPNKTCVYVVVAASALGSVTSAASNAALATPMTFTPLVPGTTRLNVAIFDEVLNAVNAVRAANGDPAASWASILPPGIAVPAPRVRIREEHLSSLRASMNAARAALGFAPLSFAQPGVRGQVVRTMHVMEIRGGVE